MALERYVKSSFDIISRLPPTLGAKILSLLPVRDLLRCQLVSTSWKDLIQSQGPFIWRHHVFHITASDPVKPKLPQDDAGWKSLYQGLHHRERNWSLGLAQEIKVMKGHKSFVTSLKKHGETVITGSYDESSVHSTCLQFFF